MHSDAVGCLKIEMRLHRLRRIHVNGLHEPAWLVPPNGQERKVNRTEPEPNVAEETCIRGVAGEKDARAVYCDHESSPQRSVSIQRTPRREMLRRRQRDRHHRTLRLLPPIEFLYPADAGRPD